MFIETVLQWIPRTADEKLPDQRITFRCSQEEKENTRDSIHN